MSQPYEQAQALPCDTLSANKAMALKFLELAFANAMNEAIELLSANATWWVSGDPQRLPVAGEKNRTQTERVLRGMHKVLPEGMSYRVLGVTAEGGRVAIEAEAEGRWYNDKRYVNCYHFLFRIEHGEIVAIREYLDTLRIFDMQ